MSEEVPDYSQVHRGSSLVRKYVPGAPLGKGDNEFFLSCGPGLLDAMSHSDLKEMVSLGWSWKVDASWVDDEYESGARWVLRAPSLVEGFWK